MLTTSCAPFSRWMLRAAPLALTLALAACSDRAADLELRLSTLQTELDRAKAELETANRKEAPAEPTALPGVSEIARNYDQGLNDFREGLRRQISDGRVTNVAHPVIDDKPYTATFGVEATLHGRTVSVEQVAARAGVDGKWSFPSPAEIVDRLNQASSAPAAQAPAPEARPAAVAPPAEARPQLVSPMQADKTIRVDWGDRPARPPGSAAPPPASSGKGQPAPRTGAPRF